MIALGPAQVSEVHPVLLAGVEVGTVRRVHERGPQGVRVRYHAALQLGGHQELPATFPVLIHGWADEPLQACNNAIHANRAGFRRALELIDLLDERMRGARR